MGDILYIVGMYNSSLPNFDSMDVGFLQGIINVHIAFLVLTEIFGGLVESLHNH